MRKLNKGLFYVCLMIGSMLASGQAQETANLATHTDNLGGRNLQAPGYWKYDSYQITPTAAELAAIKPMPGRTFEQRITGGLQTGPGNGRGSLELLFKTDNVDRIVHLATMTVNFGADANLVTLVPLQKVTFEVGVAVGANDMSRKLGTLGAGTIAIDLGEYIVSVSAKPDQTTSKKGIATIPGGGPGAVMMINVGSYLAHLGALGGTMRIRYVWVEGTPPAPPLSKPNLALNRPAKQSSTSEWSNPNDAQGAVNGVTNGSYGFHTRKEKNPWWQVDLGVVRPLTEIRIYNRVDCCADRARKIEVWLSTNGTSWKRVFANNGNIFGGKTGKPLSVALRGNSARFVRLQLAETNYFHLDEVEIY